MRYRRVKVPKEGAKRIVRRFLRWPLTLPTSPSPALLEQETRWLEVASYVETYFRYLYPYGWAPSYWAGKAALAQEKVLDKSE